MNVEISDDFKDPKDCMVIIIIEGSGDDIELVLEKILLEHRAYKPIQGVTIGASYTKQVITPVWNGKKY